MRSIVLTAKKARRAAGGRDVVLTQPVDLPFFTLGKEVDREVAMRNPLHTDRTMKLCQCCERRLASVWVRTSAIDGVALCEECSEDYRNRGSDLGERIDDQKRMKNAQSAWRRQSSFHSKAKLAAAFPLSAKKTLCREYAQVRLCRTFVRKSPPYTGAIGFKAT